MKKQRYWEVTVYVSFTQEKLSSTYPHNTYIVVAHNDIIARGMAVGIVQAEFETDEEERPAKIVFCEVGLKGDIYYNG